MFDWFFRRRRQRALEALCKQLHARGSELIERDCDPETLAILEAHLQECQDCDGWIASLKSTINLIRGVPNHQPPPELLEQIRQATTRSNP